LNLPHILQYGTTHSTSLKANSKYIPIGDKSFISSRNNFILNNGRRHGEYIPFYFGMLTPILYVVQKGFNRVDFIHAEDIVYSVSSVKKIRVGYSFKPLIDFSRNPLFFQC